MDEDRLQLAKDAVRDYIESKLEKTDERPEYTGETYLDAYKKFENVVV